MGWWVGGSGLGKEKLGGNVLGGMNYAVLGFMI